MTTLSAYEIWADGVIGPFIDNCVAQYHCGDEMRHALKSKAWEWVSLAPPDKTDKWYMIRIAAILKHEWMLYKYGEKTLAFERVIV
jgi:hypothetical protein